MNWRKEREKKYEGSKYRKTYVRRCVQRLLFVVL